MSRPGPGIPPLQLAAREGNIEKMQEVLQKHADSSIPSVDILNAVDHHTRFTALHEAARAGDYKVVEFLLRQPGINVNAHTKKTALCIAAQSGRLDVAELLLEQPGIDVNAGDPGLASSNYWASLDYSPLHAAVNWNHIDIVRLLLARPDIDVNAKKSFREMTPLHVAFWKPEKPYSRPSKMLKRSADKRYQSRRDVMLALLAHPALNANTENRSRNTPLHYTVFFDREIELVELLLRRPEVNVNAFGEGTMTPLHHAASTGKAHYVALLLSQPKIIVDPPDMYKSTPLFTAAEKGQAAVAKLLLDHGADIHAVSSKPGPKPLGMYRNTAIFIAAERGHGDVVELLMRCPGVESELAPADKNRSTPLHAAAFGGHTPVVKLLLSHPEVQATLITAGPKTTTALHLACKHGSRESVVSLLACPAVKVNAEDRRGFTSLHLAIQMGHTKVVRLLLEKEATVDCRSIHLAARLGNDAGHNIAALLAEKNRMTFQLAAESEKDPGLREFLGKVRLAVDPMGQFTVAMKHIKEEGNNSVVFAEHSSTKLPVVIKSYQDESERRHNIELLTGLKKQGVELKHVTSLFAHGSEAYFAWETGNGHPCRHALVFACEEGAGTEPRTLRTLLDRGVLKHQYNEKRLVFELVVRAIKELHDIDIAHGDLKPENLIIFNSGCLECKVIDLDNARDVKSMEWSRGGTLIYYSPELAEEHHLNGGRVQATLEGDRWAIGAMLYKLVTGQKLVCTLMERGEGDDYKTEDADVALKELQDVKQDAIDNLCKMIGEGGSVYYKHAAELIQNLLRRDRRARWRVDQMLESGFVRGGATVTIKTQLALMSKISEKWDEVSKENKELRESLLGQLGDVKTQLNALPSLPDKLAERVRSDIKGLYQLVKNVGLTPHPRCFVVLPVNLTEEVLANMSAEECDGKVLELQQFMSDIATSLKDRKPDTLLASLAKKIGNKFHRTVYVSLVCETCWRLQLPAYPVRVKKEEARKLIQAVAISLALCNLANLASGILSSFHPGVPQALVPQTMVKYLENVLNVAKEGDAASFTSVKSAIDSEAYGKVKKLGDADARSLSEFLKLVDAGREWAGLEPTVQLGHGEVKWVCKKCFQHSGQAAAMTT